MSTFQRTPPLQCVVLRTMDVGEADRFCILFSRERGRLSARARSVRKLTSRLGGTLLPLQGAVIELVEKEGSATIVSATPLPDAPPPPLADYPRFLALEQGIELLLLLTEENEPLPAVFDLLRAFLQAGSAAPPPLLPFQLRLLHLLGHLPAHDGDPRFARLPPAAQAFVVRCTQEDDLATLATDVPADPALTAFTRTVIEATVPRGMKTNG